MQTRKNANPGVQAESGLKDSDSDSNPLDSESGPMDSYLDSDSGSMDSDSHLMDSVELWPDGLGLGLWPCGLGLTAGLTSSDSLQHCQVTTIPLISKLQRQQATLAVLGPGSIFEVQPLTSPVKIKPIYFFL